MTTFFVKLTYAEHLSKVRDNEEWKRNVMKNKPVKKGQEIAP